MVGLVAGSLTVGIGLGLLTVRGTDRDSAIGSFLAFGLGVGVLLIRLNKNGYATQATNLLFGSILAVSDRQLTELAVAAAMVLVLLGLVYRPLLFASVDPEGAEARGVSLRRVSVILLVLVALATAEAIQIVGVLLVLTLVITPAAAATRLTSRPALALVLSVCIALVATEGGILLTLVKDYPPSFFISSISFALYLVARIVGSRNLSRRSADVRTGVTITPASVAGQTR